MSAASRSAVAKIVAHAPDADAEPSSDTPAIAFGPLGDSLGFHLRLAQLKAFEAFFATFTDERLQPGAVSVLITIGENPGIRQGVLAGALMIKRSHMAKIVQGFGEAGLIERQVPADDRRAVELRLTPSGRRQVEALMPKFLQHEAASTHGLSESERETLFSLLRKINGL